MDRAKATEIANTLYAIENMENARAEIVEGRADIFSQLSDALDESDGLYLELVEYLTKFFDDKLAVLYNKLEEM